MTGSPDNAAALARCAFRVFLDQASPLTLPDAAEVNARTFEMRIGYDDPLNAETTANYTALPMTLSNVQTLPGGNVESFDIAVTAGPTVPLSEQQSWEGGSSDFDSIAPNPDLTANDFFSANVRLSSFNVPYDIAMTNGGTANEWFADGTTNIIPPAAFPAHPLGNPLYVATGLTARMQASGVDERPRLPVQAALEVTGMTWGPGADSFTGILTVSFQVDHDSSDATLAGSIQGRPPVWITLGGHGSTEPYVYAVSDDNTPFGVRAPVLEDQVLLSPVVAGQGAQEYAVVSTRYITYQAVQVDRIVASNAMSGGVTLTVEMDVPASLIQSPDLTVTNVTYIAGDVTGTDVHFISAAPVRVQDGTPVIPLSAAFGPTGQSSNAILVPALANSPQDVPFAVVGGGGGSAANGGTDGIAVIMFAGGPGIPAAQPPASGAAAAALDLGYTWDGTLCPRGVIPSVARFAATSAKVPFSVTDVTSVDMALTPNSGVGSTDNAGVPSLYRIRMVSGAVPAMSSGAGLTTLLMDDTSVAATSDATVVDVCVRGTPTPTGVGSVALARATGAGIPVSVPLLGGRYDAAGSVATPTVTLSGVVDWNDTNVPRIFRPILAVGGGIGGIQINSFTDAVLPESTPGLGPQGAGGRRRHPDPAVGEVPLFPRIPDTDAQRTFVTATNGTQTLASTSDDVGTRLVNFDGTSLVGSMMSDQRYFVQASFDIANVQRDAGGTPAAATLPYPLMVGTPRITPSGHSTFLFMHADTREAAETPLLVGEGAGASPLADAAASFEDLFPTVSLASQTGALVVPPTAGADGSVSATIGLTPYASGTNTAIPGNDDAGFPATVDATTLADFSFFVTPVTFTTQTGAGVADGVVLRGRDIPATATFDATAGTVQLQVTIAPEDVDTFDQYNANPRQALAYVSVSAVFNGVRFTPTVAAPSDALVLETGTLVTRSTPPSFTITGVGQGTLRMQLSYFLAEYAVPLTPTTTPANTGALGTAPAVNFAGIFFSYTNGNLSADIMGQSQIGGEAITVPSGLATSSTDITIGGLAATDPSVHSTPASDLLWLFTPVVGMDSQTIATGGYTLALNLQTQVTAPSSDPFSLLLVNGGQFLPSSGNLLSRYLFRASDVASPIVFFPIPAPAPAPAPAGGAVVPESATQAQRDVAQVFGSAALSLPNPAVADALLRLTRILVPEREGAQALETVPNTTSGVVTELLQEAEATAVDGDRVNPYQARLIATHLSQQSAFISNDVRTPVFVNADVTTVADLERALSVTPHFVG
jgi:hypothetical protein